jgi:hypothetical protein
MTTTAIKLPWERILVFGITGSGKTWNWMMLARELKSTGAQFYVIDTDNDIEFMLATQFPDLLEKNKGNVHVYPAYSWPEYKSALETIQKIKLKENDWIVVDKINHAWDTVQRYFIKEVYKEDIGDYFLSVRKKLAEAKKDTGKNASIVKESLSGWMDWPVINALYTEWIAPIVYQVHCNVYSTTDVDKLSTDEKNAEIMQLFGDYGVRIEGQKKLGGQFHTILLLKAGTDRWQLTTIKDRGGRGYFKDTDLKSLYKQYLVMKAGWPML